MSPAARWLWHQRLAWLLMIYAGTISAVITPEYVFGRINLPLCLRVMTMCAIVMTCVKDSALRGRPVPYSWRLVMAGAWPIAVWMVEWRARRWWGLLWVAVHGFLLAVTAVIAQILYWIAVEMLQ